MVVSLAVEDLRVRASRVGRRGLPRESRPAQNTQGPLQDRLAAKRVSVRRPPHRPTLTIQRQHLCVSVSKYNKTSPRSGS